jgi:hypothetical protein
VVVRAVGSRCARRLTGIAVAALAVGSALFAGGCGRDEARVERSPFLGDISQLQPGKGDDPSLVYISPAARFSAYQSVVIDPVTVWCARGSSPTDLLRAELRALAERFESAIRTRMQASVFEVVDEPRAGALRIRAAFTERGRELRKLDVAESRGRVADTTGSPSADTLAFLRGAIELEVVDGLTGERLAAAIDDHLVAAPGEEARDRLASDTVAWRDVEAFLDARARRLAARLSALHQLDDPEPARPGAPPADE